MTIIDYVLNVAFLYQVIATLATYIILDTIRVSYIRSKRYKLLEHYGIYGGETNLLDGNIDKFLKTPFQGDLFDEGRRKFGDVSSFFTADEPSIITTHLDTLKKVFVDYSHIFNERSHRFLATPLFDGIFYAPYPRWKEQRRIMSQPFNGYALNSESTSNFINETVDMMLTYIEQKRSLELEKTGEEAKFNVRSLMKSTALHLISAIAIKLPNVKVCENEPHVISLDAFMEAMSGGMALQAVRFPCLRGFISFLANNFEHGKALGQVRRSVINLIDIGRKELESGLWNDEKRHHVIDTLIKMHYYGKLSRDEVIGNAETLLIAGYDTTSTTLTFALWNLAKYRSEVQEKLRDELMAHGTNSKYLEQIINETMRLFPTLFTFSSRLANATVEINGLTIPKGARVVHNTWLLHRDKKHWPEPTKFDPSRFEKPEKIHPCAFAPFGLGEKKCIGWQLAMTEMKRILCDIVLRYDVILCGPQEMELINYGPLMARPKEEVILQFKKINRY